MRISRVVLLATALACAAPAWAAEQTHTLDKPLTDMTDSAFVRLADGKVQAIAADKLAEQLAAYDVVFYGEIHSHPGVHLQEMKLLQALQTRNPNMIVSFEQFETDTQGLVNDYLAGKVGENALTSKGRAWGQYLTAYRPMLEYARVHKLPAVAAEAPTWAISCIGQLGPEVLDKFTPDERTLVAKDLHILKSGAYYDKYMAFAGGGGHGGDSARALRSYSAQVARDDTMAERIAAALDAHPGAKLIHYNGFFHSQGFLGTVERLKMRKPDLKIAIITPVEVEPGAVSADLSKADTATTYQLVQAVPPTFVDGEDTSSFMGSMKRTQCKYAPEAPKP